jgi:hypothetical protein
MKRKYSALKHTGKKPHFSMSENFHFFDKLLAKKHKFSVCFKWFSHFFFFFLFFCRLPHFFFSHTF